jgi:ferredoxin-NADP reductase
MKWNTFPMRLEWARNVTPTVRHLAFRREDDQPFVFTAGQFINVHWDRGDGELTHRSYSVANPPGESDLVEIAVAPVDGGFATERLFALRPGDPVLASGPYGRFVLKADPPCRYVLAATGTGVTPYRSMLPEIRALLAAGDHAFHLLLGVRRPEELLYGAEFQAVSADHEHFSFSACYSRELPNEPADWEHHGYLQHRFEHLALDPERDIVYLCGNPGMIDEAFALLKDAGFGIKQIRREKYLSARR